MVQENWLHRTITELVNRTQVLKLLMSGQNFGELNIRFSEWRKLNVRSLSIASYWMKRYFISICSTVCTIVIVGKQIDPVWIDFLNIYFIYKQLESQCKHTRRPLLQSR